MPNCKECLHECYANGMDDYEPCNFFLDKRKYAEQKHGRWMPGYPMSCSVCGGSAATDYEDANRYDAWHSPYCPNCGAKMDGVSDG